jgi:malate dehydrogenase (oxaloacetate-decarboxylating)
MAMDCTYRLRIPHHAGQLANVATRISEYGGLIGDVTTITVARQESLREITVELRDKEHAEALAAGLGELPGVTVAWFHDRAFIAHDGGKLDVVGRRPVLTHQDSATCTGPASLACALRWPSSRSWPGASR